MNRLRFILAVMLLAAGFCWTLSIQGAEIKKASLLIGNWIHVSGPTDFESMEFALEDGEYVFRSWLHDRLFLWGQWGNSGTKVTVTNKQIKIVWSVVEITKQKLVLVEEGLKTQTVFRRAPK